MQITRPSRRLNHTSQIRYSSFGLALALIGALAGPSQADFIQYLGGDGGPPGGVNFPAIGALDATSYQTLPTSPTLLFDSSLGLGGSSVTSLQAGGWYTWNSGLAAVGIDPRTRFSLSGTPSDPVSATASSGWHSAWVYENPFPPGGQVQEWLQFNLDLQITGHIDPADIAQFEIFGSSGSAGAPPSFGGVGSVSSSGGGSPAEVGMTEFSATPSGDFSASIALSSPWFQDRADVIQLSLGFNFIIDRSGPTAGDTWVSFGDPGMSVSAADTLNGLPPDSSVPEPSSASLLLVAAALPLAGRCWRRRHRDRPDSSLS